jgi:hypothetical protein
MIEAVGRLVTAALAVVVAIGTAGCQRGAPPPRQSYPGSLADKPAAEPPQAQEVAGRMATKAPAAPAPAGAAGPGTHPVEAMVAARKLIRTGQLTVEVASYAKAAEEVNRVAERHGGYVSDTRSSQDDRDAQQGAITLRVPAERFAVVMAELKKLGRTRGESVGTQDVTKAYADLETRLRVKRETVERLREILRGRTAKLSDVLEVERELARLTEEIEQLEGERRFYDNQLSLSTITLALHEPQAVVHGGFLDPIRRAFRDSLDVLAGSVAALVYAVAVLIPWVIVIWPLWRIVRAARARRKGARAAATVS